MKTAQASLNEYKTKYENSAVFIQHSCKANSLLKEEKESLDSILQDNATKLENLKKNYDEIHDKYSLIQISYQELIEENDLNNKKLAELKNLNEILTNEKEESFKVLTFIN